VSPVNPAAAKGSHKQFSATLGFSDDSSQNVTSIVTWTSSNTSVATIGTTGLAAAVGGGTATITATFESLRGQTTLKVPGPLAPKITSFSPKSGRAGTKVTVKGTNLQAASEVTFNGAKGTITKDTSTQLTVEVPTRATTGKIEVITRGGNAKTTTAFTVN
jgi:hypothetical protein